MIRAALGLLAAAGVSAFSTGARGETRFAIVVGHNVGDLHEAPLRWAESDATRFRDVLTEIGDVGSERTILLLSPTVAKLREARLLMDGRLLEAKHRGERTMLVFFFSGHADKNELHFGGEKLELAALERELKEGPAGTVLTIIDACRNDRAPRMQEKGAVRAPAFSWPTEPNTPEGFVRLNSAAEGEVAQESDDLQGSLFTHHLLSGMRGGADYDRDGTVTVSELYHYGYSKTLEDTHRQAAAVQHSEMEMALAGRGALIVTYPRRAAASLRLADDVSGHVLIIDDASGRVVAEVFRENSEQVSIAVARGTYRVQLRRSSEIRSGLIALDRGEKSIALADLAVQPALAVMMKGAGYDPHPYVASAGFLFGTSAVGGFGWSPAARAGLEYRLDQAWRGVVAISGGYSSAENMIWQYRQLELSALLGVDFGLEVGEGSALVFGARAGVAGVVQRAEHQQKARLDAAGVPVGVSANTHSVFGPRVGAVFGFEYRPWTQLGLRLTAEPSLSWIDVEGRPATSAGMLGALSLLVRL